MARTRRSTKRKTPRKPSQRVVTTTRTVRTTSLGSLPIVGAITLGKVLFAAGATYFVTKNRKKTTLVLPAASVVRPVFSPNPNPNPAQNPAGDVPSNSSSDQYVVSPPPSGDMQPFTLGPTTSGPFGPGMATTSINNGSQSGPTAPAPTTTVSSRQNVLPNRTLTTIATTPTSTAPAPAPTRSFSTSIRGWR